MAGANRVYYGSLYGIKIGNQLPICVFGLSNRCLRAKLVATEVAGERS